ncbi:unnamed protein product, partial [marine sediment metagenome]
MADEDLSTYIEHDIPANRLGVTPSTATMTDLDMDETVWLEDDKGVDHFDGDYEHFLTVRLTEVSLDD